MGNDVAPKKPWETPTLSAHPLDDDDFFCDLPEPGTSGVLDELRTIRRVLVVLVLVVVVGAVVVFWRDTTSRSTDRADRLVDCVMQDRPASACD